MNGAFVKVWVAEKKLRPEELAARMGVCITTIYKWYRSESLDKRTQLALAQIGCVEPKSRPRQASGA